MTSNVAVGSALGQPPEKVGPALFALAEDQWFDRKSIQISPAKLTETLVSLANAEGGTLVIGLSDGKLEGTDGLDKHRNELIQAAMDRTVPPVRTEWKLIECHNSKGKPDHLLVIEVEPSPSVHATTRDVVYLRVGDEDRKLSFHQRQELHYDKGQATFDATFVPDLSVDDLDDSLLASYAEALMHPDPPRLLVARGLMSKEGELTAGAVLLFGATPQAIFPEAYVRVIRYRGSDRGTGARQEMLRDTRFEGPIPEILMSAAGDIRQQQPVRKALGRRQRFEPRPLIPEDAWLEGLVNAVVHRSYSLGGDHIRVEIFDDRIEIESPGRFPGVADVKEPLRIARFARNPRVARVCADLNFGQEIGEGIRRMYEEMRAAGLGDPLYRQTTGSVRLTLSATPVDREMMSRLPSRSGEILDALRQTDHLSTGDLSEHLDMSRPAILTRLRALQGEGVIEWVGKTPRDPRAFWRIKWPSGAAS